MNFELTVLTIHAPIKAGKIFWLDENIELKKDTKAHYIAGTALKKRIESPEHLKELIESLTPNESLLAGVNAQETINVSPTGAFGRDNETFQFAKAPALMVIDSDDLSEAEGKLAICDALCDACPAIADTVVVQAPSTSSNILTSDGGILRGLKGVHTYIVVKNGQDIPRALEALHKRLWLKGHGRPKISETGRLLERSYVDLALKSPSQPVYQHAHCGAGLKQDKIPDIYDGSFDMLDTEKEIAPLSAEELRLYNALVAKAANAMADQMKATSETYIERSRQVLIDRGTDSDEADRLAKAFASGKATTNLWGDAPITMSGGTVVTVREILNDRATYHGQTCRDPAEPSYGGSQVAKIFLNAGGKNLIESFAHGGRQYYLHESDPDFYRGKDPSVKSAQRVHQSERNVIGASEFMAELKPPCYVWRGIAQKNNLYAITAPPGSGKTAIALALALAMAMGDSVHGRETMTSRVLYLCGENPDDVKLRFKVLLGKREISQEQVEGKIFFTRKPFNIDNDTARKDFLAEASQHAPYDVIFIDTVPAHSGIEDENANTQSQTLALALRSLGQSIGEPCIFALMHPSKEAKKDNLLPRGASSFTGSIDGVICIWREPNQSQSEMFAHKGKFRGHWPETFHFELEEITIDEMTDNFGYPAKSVIATEVQSSASSTTAREIGQEAAHNLRLPSIKMEVLVFIKFIADRGGWLGDQWDSSNGNHLCAKRFIDYPEYPSGLLTGRDDKKLAIKAITALLTEGLLVKESREIPNSTAKSKRDRSKDGLWLTEIGLKCLTDAGLANKSEADASDAGLDPLDNATAPQIDQKIETAYSSDVALGI